MSASIGPLRIALFVYWLSEGGMEQHTLHLARAFAARGDRVTVGYMERADGDRLLADEPFDRVNLSVRRPVRRVAALRRAYGLALRSDVVHCTGWDASAWGRLAGGLARRPVIVTDHRGVRAENGTRVLRTTGRSVMGLPASLLVPLHNRLLDPVTTVMVAVAESQVEHLRREGVDGDKITVIPNGVDLDALRRAARHGFGRAELGVPHDALVILHVARFVSLKRQQWSYEAAATLRRELGDVHVLFAGDGPEREDFERRVRANGDRWVHFLGHRDDVPRLLALSDLAVLPSSGEALPMAMLEALAVGVPQVGADVGDLGRVLRETGAGLVVDPQDHAAFTAACRLVLADRERAEVMRGAAARAADAFALDRMVAAYEGVFERAVAGAR